MLSIQFISKRAECHAFKVDCGIDSSAEKITHTNTMAGSALDRFLSLKWKQILRFSISRNLKCGAGVEVNVKQVISAIQNICSTFKI